MYVGYLCINGRGNIIRPESKELKNTNIIIACSVGSDCAWIVPGTEKP